MRVVVLIKATADSEADLMPSTEQFPGIGKFNEAYADAGILASGDGLHPSSKAKRAASTVHNARH